MIDFTQPVGGAAGTDAPRWTLGGVAFKSR
jgi:hypothetical protein